MTTGAKRKVGRPTLLSVDKIRLAGKVAALGATDVEIADALEIDVATFYRWKSRSQEFADALKAGKEPADDRVERSLYLRAVGYTYESVKVFNDKGNALIVPIREHVPPDVTAQIFWLKNRRRDAWRDRHDHELTGKDGGPIEQEITEIRRTIVDPRPTDAASVRPASPAPEL